MEALKCSLDSLAARYVRVQFSQPVPLYTFALLSSSHTAGDNVMMKSSIVVRAVVILQLVPL